MLVATALNTLDEATCEYVIYEKTKINTALGPIVIIEITKEGLVLIAGPSTKTDMLFLVSTLKKYNPRNIYIDGALFRKSLAATSLSDSLILSTGAAYDSNMNKTVEDTKIIVDQFLLQPISKEVKELIISRQENLVINSNNEVKYLGSFWDKANKDTLKNNIDHKIKYLYINGALTDNIINTLIKIRHGFSGFTLIIQDATHIVSSSNLYMKLHIMNIDVKLLNKMELLVLTYNPYSPFGYEYDNEDFKEALKYSINVKTLNVLKDME